jgi:hypothetical protein
MQMYGKVPIIGQISWQDRDGNPLPSIWSEGLPSDEENVLLFSAQSKFSKSPC